MMIATRKDHRPLKILLDQRILPLIQVLRPLLFPIRRARLHLLPNHQVGFLLTHLDEDCVAMSNGLKVVFNQTNLVDKNFTAGLDVSLGEAASLENFVESNLEEQLQSYLVPAVAGCPNVSRRRRLCSLPAMHRRPTSNYAIGNGIVKVACNSQVACQTLSSEICYQCLVDLQLFLKADITGLTMVIAGVMEQDLMELFKLDSPFLDVKASSIQAAEPTAAPSSAPTLKPSTHPSSFPSDRPSTKITGNQTSRPTPGPTPPPTPLPTPGLTSQFRAQLPLLSHVLRRPIILRVHGSLQKLKVSIRLGVAVDLPH